MNKKKLSVVMAGAMLASSVAPVLAAEVQKSEMSADNLGLVIKTVREKLNSAKFADETKADKTRNDAEAGKSIYEVKVGEKVLNLDVDSTQQNYQDAFATVKAGDVVEIWSKGYVKEGEKYYATEEKAKTYNDLADAATAMNDLVTQIEKYTKIIDANDTKVENSKVKVAFSTDAKKAGFENYEITLDDVIVDATKYINKDNVVVDPTNEADVEIADFKTFAKTEDVVNKDIKGEKLEEITITSGGKNFAIEDLYDGLMLTTKGHDFFSTLKASEKSRNDAKRVVTGNTGTAITNTTTAASAIEKDVNGKYSFTVTIADNGSGLGADVYTVIGTNEKDVERLAYWVKTGVAKVDILAGSNRYATAVQIAKEYAGLTDAVHSGEANVVLVNGESLVDGLAAAPLAATVKNDSAAAPVLLTESDRLPKETRAYLKEVIGSLQINAVKKATIHIVGGEAVVSKDLERELKALGFSVERYGGANREETSLEVAEAIGNDDKAFVVGANGEADAMSIAAVAANKTAATPIIVAKNGGISEDAVYELRDKDVVIVGGEATVTEAEEEEIGLEAKSVTRIAGKNRQETNAKVISTYYNAGFGGATKNVVVAKDGQHKKSELIDALAAANFASEKNAPIVLATNKLSDEQINALELKAKDSEALYQVGIGVDKDNVVKVIAQRLGLTN